MNSSSSSSTNGFAINKKKKCSCSPSFRDTMGGFDCTTSSQRVGWYDSCWSGGWGGHGRGAMVLKPAWILSFLVWFVSALCYFRK